MITYNRTREYGTGCHVNPNEWNVDHRDEPGNILVELQESGLNPLGVDCDHEFMQLSFPDALTQEQEATMDQVISAHKAAVDWPPLA